MRLYTLCHNSQYAAVYLMSYEGKGKMSAYTTATACDGIRGTQHSSNIPRDGIRDTQHSSNIPLDGIRGAQHSGNIPCDGIRGTQARAHPR